MYIYIITNPDFKGWIKLGRTINLTERLIHYQTHCPLRNYEISYSIKTNDYRIIETYFYNNVSGNGYEWYNCSIEFAIELINKIINESKNDPEIFKNKFIGKRRPGGLQYDYMTDGKIFRSLKELSNYVGVIPCRFYGKKKDNFAFKHGIEINGFIIDRKIHIE